MSEENNAKAQPEIDDKNTNHGRRVMITTDGSWTVWRFEFDAQDGQGVVWHQGRSMGSSNSVENSTGHFIEKGYTVVEWQRTTLPDRSGQRLGLGAPWTF